ncbi:hypothetical protein FHS27_005020 [Rhodopirellula rubra]|uniref:Uncharacterized protein n=1 Tax=Aporhodopirellula rubra TaxID=980271 RepID=A0A7W5H725_9BACT|nr:hypothetical protein [Aporhodopirellula rubra]
MRCYSHLIRGIEAGLGSEDAAFSWTAILSLAVLALATVLAGDFGEPWLTPKRLMNATADS